MGVKAFMNNKANIIGIGHRDIQSTEPIYNYIDKRVKSKINKKALLCYLTPPITRLRRGEKLAAFSTDGLAVTIPKCLNELGYSVDIINWDDTSFKPTLKYDLIIAHGGKITRVAEEALKIGGELLYFSSGSYWEYHNTKEKERFYYFTERHNLTLPYDRLIGESEERLNSIAKGIICLGNSTVANSYSKFKNVMQLCQ